MQYALPEGEELDGFPGIALRQSAVRFEQSNSVESKKVKCRTRSGGGYGKSVTGVESS